MLSYEPEILASVSRGLLTEKSASRLLPIERREVFSLYGELRLAAWLAVALIATGAGIFIRKNFHQIGPATLIAALAMASAICYAVIVVRKRDPERWPASLLDDYILLLGALLLSADLGYAESQYHLLGARWTEHFLVLAVVHGLTAYYFDSRALLSLSLASLASWLGFRGNFESEPAASLGGRALLASGLTLLWRVGNRAFPSRRSFDSVFDHFIALFAFFGGLLWLFDFHIHGVRSGELTDFELWGLLVIIATSVASLSYAFRTGSEAFAVYAIAAILIAANYELISRFFRSDPALSSLVLLITSATAVVALYQIHIRLKEGR